MKALRGKQIAEHNSLMSAAWHAAVIPMMKRPPKLKELLVDDGKAQPRQSREEIERNLMIWLRPREQE